MTQKKALLDAANVPPPAVVPPNNRPAYYEQRYDGYTMNELLAMKEDPGTHKPAGFTRLEFISAVQRQIQAWAVQATKHRDLKPGGRSYGNNKPAGNDTAPAEPNATQAVDDVPEANEPETETLSPEDRETILDRPADIVSDPEKFKRHESIADGVHPDTGNPIDLQAEKNKARKTGYQSVVDTIVDLATKNPEVLERLAPAKGVLGDDYTASDEPLPDEKETTADAIQLAGDAVGIFDPSGIVDASNAGFSLYRAYKAKEPEQRREHLVNAAISGVSAVPFIGDLAKLGKAKWAAKAAKNTERLAKAKSKANAFEQTGKFDRWLGRDAIAELGRRAKDGFDENLADLGDNIPDMLERRKLSPVEIAQRFYHREIQAGRDEQGAAYVAGLKWSSAVKAMEQGKTTAGAGSPAASGDGNSNAGGNRNGNSNGIGPNPVNTGPLNSPTGGSGNSGGNGGGGGGNIPPASGPGSPEDDNRKRRELAEEIERETDARKQSVDLFNVIINRFLAITAIVSIAATAVRWLSRQHRKNQMNVMQNQELASFDPEIAAAYAQRDIADVRRKIRESEQLSESLSDAAGTDAYASDVKSRFTTPIKQIAVDIQSAFTGAVFGVVDFVDNLTGASTALSVLADLTNKATALPGQIADFVQGNDPSDDRDQDTAFARFLDDISDGKFDDQTARDRYFDKDRK